MKQHANDGRKLKNILDKLSMIIAITSVMLLESGPNSLGKREPFRDGTSSSRKKFIRGSNEHIRSLTAYESIHVCVHTTQLLDMNLGPAWFLRSRVVRPLEKTQHIHM
eukprot:6252324-Amphidinium_carterae.2